MDLVGQLGGMRCISKQLDNTHLTSDALDL